MTSESRPVGYIIAIAARWTKSVKFTLSIAKKRIGEQLKERSRGSLLARAALHAASVGYN